MLRDTFSVYWTETAFQDLENIIDHIAIDSIDPALDIYKKIQY